MQPIIAQTLQNFPEINGIMWGILMSLLVLYVSNNPLDEHQTSQNDVFLFCYHRKIIVSFNSSVKTAWTQWHQTSVISTNLYNLKQHKHRNLIMLSKIVSTGSYPYKSLYPERLLNSEWFHYICMKTLNISSQTFFNHTNSLSKKQQKKKNLLSGKECNKNLIKSF